VKGRRWLNIQLSHLAWALTLVHQGEVMTTKYEAAEALKMLDEAKAKEFDWESNRDDENPEQLPWPEENESKE